MAVSCHSQSQLNPALSTHKTPARQCLLLEVWVLDPQRPLPLIQAQRHQHQLKKTLYKNIVLEEDRYISELLELKGEEGLKGLTLLPRLECSGWNTAHCSLNHLGSKTGSHYVNQTGLELLDSSNPPASVSQRFPKKTNQPTEKSQQETRQVGNKDQYSHCGYSLPESVLCKGPFQNTQFRLLHILLCKCSCKGVCKISPRISTNDPEESQPTRDKPVPGQMAPWFAAVEEVSAQMWSVYSREPVSLELSLLNTSYYLWFSKEELYSVFYATALKIFENDN
ncbi:hypothetical protein AAY473_020739, partial [Plecturocebus cupreus]